jgi:hypothetical protein
MRKVAQCVRRNGSSQQRAQNVQDGDQLKGHDVNQKVEKLPYGKENHLGEG